MESEKAGMQMLDPSYLTSGLSWRADYVGVISPDEGRLSLVALVTLWNTSGISYEKARLQLIAGDVNVVEPPRQALYTIAQVTARGNGNVQQENYFEYHLYTLARPSTIENNQTKQL
jgi:hypothetical protein